MIKLTYKNGNVVYVNPWEIKYVEDIDMRDTHNGNIMYTHVRVGTTDMRVLEKAEDIVKMIEGETIL